MNEQQLINNINYNHIHDDYKSIIINNKVPPLEKLKKLPFLMKILLSPLKYHSLEAYRSGVV